MTKEEYKEYLQSSHWKKRAKEFKAGLENGKRCFVCGRYESQCGTGNFNVHHTNYARLWNETDNDLRLLCSDCHRIVHNLIDEAVPRYKDVYKQHEDGIISDFDLIAKSEKLIYQMMSRLCINRDSGTDPAVANMLRTMLHWYSKLPVPGGYSKLTAEHMLKVFARGTEKQKEEFLKWYECESKAVSPYKKVTWSKPDD